MIKPKAYFALLMKSAERGQSGLTISEPAGGQYKRQAIDLDNPTPVLWKNQGLIPWGVNGLAILTEPAGGKVLDAFSLDTALVVSTFDTLEVNDFDMEETFDLTLSGGH